MRLILLFCILFSITVNAQNSFPDKWVGEYAGNMIIANRNAPNDTIPVDFALKKLIKDSVWTYRMEYHSIKFGEIVKDYRIVAVERGNKVDFLLDELNGIVMEQTIMNDCMYGMYEVMGSIYTVTLRLHDSDLIMELYGSPTENPKITVSISDNDKEAGIEAKSYKPRLVQSVFLRRKN